MLSTTQPTTNMPNPTNDGVGEPQTIMGAADGLELGIKRMKKESNSPPSC
jgi:hypothetical protein